MNFTIVTHRLTPTDAEVRIYGADGWTGRIVGPRCRFATTIEIAYPFQPARRDAPPGTLQAVIPEPSLWEPTTPFRYEVVLQREGEKARRSIGLRRVELGPKGLRLNQRPFALNGVTADSLTDEEALELRAAGVNAIVCSVRPETAPLWDLADRVGLFVIGKVARDALALAESLRHHPCCLAWLVPAELEDAPRLLQAIPGGEPLLGCVTSGTAPAWANFAVGNETDVLARFLPARWETKPRDENL